jgi:hypothetical protein
MAHTQRKYISRTDDTPRDEGGTPKGTPNDVTMLFPRTAPSSRSIPIVHVERSPSELQLEHDESMAEYREYTMYNRITTAKQLHHFTGIKKVPALHPPDVSPPSRDSSCALMLSNDASVYQKQIQGAPCYGYKLHMVPLAPCPMYDDDYREEGIFELEL